MTKLLLFAILIVFQCCKILLGKSLLDLRTQQMQTLGPSLFNDSSNLYEEIDASGTGIEYITASVIMDEVTLTILRMDNNPKFLPRRNNAFLISDSLESYSCNACGFTTIYTLTFSQLKSLKSLNLSSNKLSLIEPDAFKFNIQLERVNLSRNELDERTNYVDVFGGTNNSFKVIDLSYNPSLRMIPGRALLASLTIEELYLNNCGFDVIDGESFTKLPHLKQLILKSNFIYHIDKNAFTSNRHLTYLTLEHNKLRKLDGRTIVDSLQYLCLADNNFGFTSSYLMLWQRYDERNLNQTVGEVCESQNEFVAFDYLIRKQQAAVLGADISSAFISTYLVVILLTEAVVILLLVLYLVKLTKRLSTADLSKTILNNNQIYKIYKTN